jgi:molybdate transport system substrate-binding protein
MVAARRALCRLKAGHRTAARATKIHTRSAQFLDRLAAVPFHRIGHRRDECIQFLRGAPDNIVMFFSGERKRPIFRARPINQPDVFVRVVDPVNVQKSWSNQSARAWFRRWWAFTQKFDVEPAFFARFAQRGLFGILVQLNMAANRQPFVELAVMHEEHSPVFDDENGDREIDLFVNMRHARRTLEPAGAFVNRRYFRACRRARKSVGMVVMRTLVVLCAMLLGLSARAAELTVFAAASLSDALKEISSAYEKSTGDRVNFNFAASSTLARQIQEGARADLFFSADEEKMDQLETKNLVRKQSRRSILSNSLVIAVSPESSLRNAADLRQVRRLALAEPNSVPAGIYAKKYLEQEQLWADLKEKIVPTENVRAALAAVESGNADAAIVYKTDAAISKKMKVGYEVPASAGPRISYPLAILTESRNGAAVEKLWQYLQTPAATKTFEKFGFVVLPVAATRNGNG